MLKLLRLYLLFLVLYLVSGNTLAQHLGFEGRIFVTTKDSKTKQKKFLNLYFHAGQVFIDSLIIRGAQRDVILDQKSGNAHVFGPLSTQGLTVPVSYISSRLSEVILRDTEDRIDLNNVSLIIKETGKTAKVWGYPCREVSCVMRVKTKKQLEALKLNMWMTDSAGLKLIDFKPLAERIYNNSDFLKDLSGMPRIISPFFLNAFPVEINAELISDKESPGETISLWIYPGKVRTAMFILNMKSFLSPKESITLIDKDLNKKKK